MTEEGWHYLSYGVESPRPVTTGTVRTGLTAGRTRAAGRRVFSSQGVTQGSVALPARGVMAALPPVLEFAESF